VDPNSHLVVVVVVAVVRRFAVVVAAAWLLLLRTRSIQVTTSPNDLAFNITNANFLEFQILPQNTKTAQ